MIGLLWTIVALQMLSNHAMAGERVVWIDTDPACTLESTQDVDDCWAILAALRSNELNVIGLSTVFGNSSIKDTTQSARLLLHTIATHEPCLALPPVSPGSGRPIRDQDELPPAVENLAAALTTHRLTILALGPLTNVALLLRHYPTLIPRIESIVAVAGQRPRQVFRVGKTPLLHLHDLNVRKDPNAVDFVLRSGIRLHLIPFEAASGVMITGKDLDALERRRVLDAWLTSRSRPWLSMWETLFGAGGFVPFDALAVTYLLAPEEFTCQEIPARLVRRHGLFAARDTLEVSSSFEDESLVRYCYEVSDLIRDSPLKLLTGEGVSLRVMNR